MKKSPTIILGESCKGTIDPNLETADSSELFACAIHTVGPREVKAPFLQISALGLRGEGAQPRKDQWNRRK